MREIHSQAIVENGAELGENVKVGAFAYIGPNAQIGDNCILHPRSTIIGSTQLGENCEVCTSSVLGGRPQTTNLASSPEQKLIVGKNCTFREHTSVHVGSQKENNLSVIGDNFFMMAQSHIGHDCQIGNNVTVTTGCAIAGHVRTGNNVMFGGACGVHQFVRIGDYAMIGGGAVLVDDVVPFGMVIGNRAELSGMNVVGLRRNGFSRTDIKTIRDVYRALFNREGVFKDRLAEAQVRFKGVSIAESIFAFVEADRKRPLCRSRIT